MATLVPPRLRETRLDDYEKIRELGLEFSLDLPAQDDWRRLWLDNPLRAKSGDFPIGWVLETPDGEMVGTMGTVRVPYKFRGSDLVSAVSRAWFVKTPYRPFALLLMNEYLNQPGVDLYINNAVSVPALESFNQFCERIPVGQWDSMSFWITGHFGFAKRALAKLNVPWSQLFAYPVGAALWSKDVVANQSLPKSASSFAIETTDRFDQRFDGFWDELIRLHPEKLLAERTSSTLSWHFGAPLRKGRLWVLTATRNGKLAAYCTLTRQDHAFRLPALPHGDTQGIRAMRLVDYQSIEPGIDLLSALLSAALERCAKENVYILEHLGFGVPKMHALDNTAPYRKKLSNWKFFYRATDADLGAELRLGRVWDPSAYDGDASFE